MFGIDFSYIITLLFLRLSILNIIDKAMKAFWMQAFLNALINIRMKEKKNLTKAKEN